MGLYKFEISWIRSTGTKDGSKKRKFKDWEVTEQLLSSYNVEKTEGGC